MKNIKRKINYKGNSKIDIEINKDIILIEQKEVLFKYRKIIDKICPIFIIGTILKERKSNDCISLHYFINCEDRPSISTKLPYSPTSVNKKDIACNDNTETIKLTLWRSCIDYVNQSSVYFVQQGKVREWPKGTMSIAATPSTSDKPRKESIVKSKSILKELISYCVQCPPTSVNIASSIKYCPQCAK